MNPGRTIPTMAPSKPLSPIASRLLVRAQHELREKRFGAAEHSLTSVLALAPDNTEALRLMGVLAQLHGDHARALPFLHKAIADFPDDVKLHMALGIAQVEVGDIEAGIASLQCACEREPRVASTWFNLGKALKLDMRMDSAVSALKRALMLDATHILARLALADTLASLGKVADGIAEYRNVLIRQPDNATAWLALANLKTVPFDLDDARQLECEHAKQGLSEDSRILLGFALARAREDRHDFAGAFAALEQANASQRRRLRWDAAVEHAKSEAIMRAFAGIRPVSGSVQRGQEVILIVSLPRSGSTLVEHILASHPEVEGAHEIPVLPNLIDEESRRRQSPFPGWVHAATPQDWDRMGAEYLARTERWRQRRPRFTDKNLVNWKFVGAAIRMLPGAKVVSVHRDPLETCLGCWRQWFARGAEFGYDLDEMADHYIDYDRIRRFWQQAFPDSVFDFQYEGLLADPEDTVRSMLEFCGLSFAPACLAFHETERVVLSAPSAAQVRQPLRHDTARSEFYGDRLDPLRIRLRNAGVSCCS